MQVNAMFYVQSFTKLAGSDFVQVILLPVTRNVSKNPHSGANPGGTYESPNVDWAKYTPSGRIEMTVSTGTGAAHFFEDNLGKDVPLLFG